MPTPVTVKVARLSRRGVCTAVALALGLTCIVLVIAASTGPVAGIVDASTTPSPAVAAGAYTTGPTNGAVGEVAREAASPVGSVKSPPVNSMCDNACVSAVSETCTVAGGLTVTTLLALFLASRRDTFMGLLARTRPRALPRQWRRQTPWTVLSPISLCVLRV